MDQYGSKTIGDPPAAPHIWRMTNQPTTIERAFTLARSGDYESVNDIRQQLKKERFDQVEAHLAGHSINRELRALCEAARRDRPAAPDASLAS